MHSGKVRLRQLKLRATELLELEQDVFEKQALQFAVELDVACFLAEDQQKVGNPQLDLLRAEHNLQAIAIIGLEGQALAFSGLSPQLLLNRFPQDVRSALDGVQSTRFAVSQRGVVLLTVLPVEKSDRVQGALLITQSFLLGTEFEDTLLVYDQGVQSKSAHSEFMQPYVQRGGIGDLNAPMVLMEGALMLETVALPGIPLEQASLMVGVNQREIVAHYRDMLQQWLQIVGGLILLIALVGLFLSRHLMGPVYRLIDAARHVMTDREEVEWPPVTRDEFGILNGVLREMTNRVHDSLKQSEEARAEAERFNRVKTDFLANISHELRTPLNGIIGMTETLSETPLQDEQKECIRIIRMSSDQLVTVIGDIFDASRIESKALQLRREDFDLAEMLADFVSLTRMKAQQKGLTVRYHFKPNTPERVIGDRTRIRQILSNLVNNAIKFTKEGGIEIHVCSHSLHEGMSEFVFTIKDTGIGMEQWKVQNLFRVFEQGDTSSSRRFGGLGLGLTIISKITEKMSGKMAVLSEPGKGSSFSVMLPLNVPDVVVPKKSEEKPLLWKRVPKVLVAEDNKMNQIVVRRVLDKLGCQTVLAANGVEAVERFAESEFDVVLMDCQMPEMDGYEATRKIHEQIVEMPVIAVTAHSLDADRKQCFDAGMVDHITKPIDESVVLQVLRKHLKDLI
ncbi:response regulator [Verrucomicrobiota bacterium]